MITTEQGEKFPRFKNKRRTPFTMLANAVLRNPHLTLKSKGLLGLMLSFPDDWQYHMSHLETLSADKTEAHRSALKELIDFGYVTRKPRRNEKGQRKGYDYEVSDEGWESQESEIVSPARIRFPEVGKTEVGKSATTNTDNTKTEITKIKTHVISPDGEAYTEPNPSESEQPTTPDALTESSQSTGKARKLTDDQSPEKVAGGAAALAEAWNQHCGPLPKANRMTADRAKRCNALTAELGEDATAFVADAAREVAADSFWRERRYGFDNLLAGKVVGKAEAWRARQDRAVGSPLSRRKYD